MQGSLQRDGFTAGFSAANFFEQRKRLFPSAEAFHPLCGRAILDDNMLCEVKPWMDANQLARRNLSDGERFEVAVQLKDALLEKGREKMSEGGGDKKSDAAKSGSSVTDKPDTPEKPKAHDTQKEIASNLGWSTGKVAQAEVVRREAPETWEEVKTGAKTVNAAYVEVKAAEQEAKKPHVSFNSGENEWYTPPKFTDANRLARRNLSDGEKGCLKSDTPERSDENVAASLGISRGGRGAAKN